MVLPQLHNPSDETADSNCQQNTGNKGEHYFLRIVIGNCGVHFLTDIILTVNLVKEVVHFVPSDFAFGGGFVPGVDCKAVVCPRNEEVVLVVRETG